MSKFNHICSRSNSRNLESGSSLVEVLVAFAVLSISFAMLSMALSNWRMAVFEANESGRAFDLKQRVLNKFDCNATVTKNLVVCSTGTWKPATPYDRSCSSAFTLKGKETEEPMQPSMTCRVVTPGLMEFFFDYEKKSADRKSVKRLKLVDVPILCRTTSLPTKVCFP